MDESASSRPTNTPEGSVGADEHPSSSAKNPALKDRQCQYCRQAFTSSSLGRHLDQFMFKKKPDGIHDVEEIRRIRSEITRRQARTSSGRRDTPERTPGKRQQDLFNSGDSGTKPRDGAYRMMFNTPTWHATGVINDIPHPSQAEGSSSHSRIAPSQSRTGSFTFTDRHNSGNPDTMRALELALREVLDNIKAATTRMRPRLSPFDFDIQSQTFPSLCLQLLPPPPSLFATNPFPSPTSFPLQPPGTEHLEIVRQALRAKIEQWQSDQLSSAESSSHPHSGRPSTFGLDSNMITRSAQQHEDLSLRHLELAFKHWASLSQEMRRDAWQLEITRAFAREMDKRKSLDEQLARVQQEANQLRAQVERLGSCQWPREFALFPPDTLPLPRDVARELDAHQSQISPSASRWDYDNVVAKWKRVVMHDKGMGRVGVGYTGSVQQQQHQEDTPQAAPSSTETRQQQRNLTSTTGSGEDRSTNRMLHPPTSSSALSPDPSPTNPTPSNSATRSPEAAPHSKRPRLMNGHHTTIAAIAGTGHDASEGNVSSTGAPPPLSSPTAPSSANSASTQRPAGSSSSWSTTAAAHQSGGGLPSNPTGTNSSAAAPSPPRETA
ncbi:uncharacterized protein BP01DRAFT_341145 [Aspergillus saccharolyticus JOP 1030-1]|uniref:Uncharacterized protein n=1 Tax=Aspergillus saccharolyticus JOP 1030-1 TaxID=1450539 RepID=A0A318ZFJ7_9EURO|nr:hypothetical protein BP01DRAFT_341145 [Aspergillus saccharolyticus JOP 1030-1]PYH45104.1 hypothetical protein BP01DRAFT_341145 [Aspergillus saccharolyticus JOP 1030-1]